MMGNIYPIISINKTFICSYSISNFYQRNILFLQTLEWPWVSYIAAKQNPDGIIPSISSSKIHQLKTFLLRSCDSASSKWGKIRQGNVPCSHQHWKQDWHQDWIFFFFFCHSVLSISHIKIWGILSVYSILWKMLNTMLPCTTYFRLYLAIDRVTSFYFSVFHFKKWNNKRDQMHMIVGFLIFLPLKSQKPFFLASREKGK